MKQVEILQHARDYLDQIGRFIDPITQQPLPADSVLQDLSVRKSLFFASRNLGWVIAYDTDQYRPTFTPDPVLRRKVKPEEQNVDLEKMTTLLNWTSDMAVYRGLRGPLLMEYLDDRNFLHRSGSLFTITPTGAEIGLLPGEGDRSLTLYFTPSAQQFFLDNADDIADYLRALYSAINAPHKKHVIDNPDQLQDNVRVVKALAQGLHPVTGQPLPAGDPAAQERMKTCFGYVTKALERALELGYLSAKGPFRMSRETWSRLAPFDEPLTLSNFFWFLEIKPYDSTAALPLRPQDLGDILEAEGLMTREPTSTGRDKKLVAPTPKGAAMGITLQTMTGADGRTFDAIVYPPAVQQLLIDKLEQFVQD